MEKRSAAWWVTTIIGVAGGVLVLVGPQVGGDIGNILTVLGGAICAALGVAHPGTMKRPQP